MQVFTSRNVQGSSPHTRGAQEYTVTRSRKARIIPAYAGSTFSGCIYCRIRPDHPRIRGEHATVLLTLASSSGSSPHTRGARDEAHRRIRMRRIIPAYAGST